MKNKLLALTAAAVLAVVSLAGCGENSADTSGSDNASSANTTAAPSNTSAASVSENTGSDVEEINLDFTLQNLTGVEIHGVYVSESTKNDWEENLIPEDYVLPDGNEIEITFPEGMVVETEMFDIMCEDSDGNSIYFTEIDLSKASVVTLEFEDGNPTASIK